MPSMNDWKEVVCPESRTAAVLAVSVPVLVLILTSVLFFPYGFPLIVGTYVLITIIVYASLRRTVEAHALQSRGIPATARLVDAKQTATAVDEVYVRMRLSLEIRPPYGEPYRAVIKPLIHENQVEDFFRDVELPVLIDPSDRSKVALVEETDEPSRF